MTNEDTPPGEGFVPVDDDASPAGEEWPPQVQAAATFSAFLESADRPIKVLRQVVTPESVPAWLEPGTLDEVDEMLSELSLATGVQFAHDEQHEPLDDVAYVRFISMPDADQSYYVDAEVLAGGQIVTLQHRPELGQPFDGWRIHGIGDYLRPEQLPPRA